MATVDPVVAGDINQTRTITRTEFGTLEDGTGDPGVATVVAHIWRGDIEPVDLECSVDDGAECVFTIDFGDEYGWLATVATAGPWLLEYQATFTEDGAQTITVPAVWPDTIIVRDDHDPATL